MFQNIKTAVVVIAGIGIWLFSGVSSAIPINTCQTGACGGSVTVADLTLSQVNGNTVGFSLSNSVSNLNNDDNSTFISEFFFNYVGNSSSLSFSPVLGPIGTSYSFSSGAKTNAGLSFNLDLELPTSNQDSGTQRFKNGETITWNATGTGPLSVNDFVNPMMVHIQSLVNGDSAKYIANSVPAPAAAALIGLGLIGFASASRLKKKA